MSVKSLQLAEVITSDPRWISVVERDSKADGIFYYAVKTTGIYCRPTCPARTAHPENVQFYDTCESAENAGFRPCKRCKPDQVSLAEEHAAMVEKICHFIETSETLPSLNELAKRAGLSTYYFHRVFKAMTGLTPKSYAAAYRNLRVKNELDHSSTVTNAIFNSGYNSSSRFYERSNELLGMTPTNYRAGGANTDIRFAIGDCSLGSILVASSERGLCAILIDDDPEFLIRDLQDRFPQANLLGGDSKFEELIAKVVGFVETPAIGLDLPLDIRGTAFQQRVWQALRKIPVGSTASYSEIAKQIGAPKAFRAVAQACAANALAIAIPCHRVIRNDGGLSGYRWGLERKRELLDREAQNNNAK